MIIPRKKSHINLASMVLHASILTIVIHAALPPLLHHRAEDFNCLLTFIQEEVERESNMGVKHGSQTWRMTI